MHGRTITFAVASGALGLLIGFVLGGISPRGEVARSAVQIEELQAELEQRGDRRGWRSPVPGLDHILRAPEGEPGFEQEQREGEGDFEPDAGPRRSFGERINDRVRNAPAEDRLLAFERAISIQNVRRVQSRAALREQADLSDEEVEQVDAIISTLNEELLGNGEELILLALGEEAPTARDLLGITHDVTGILHRAQLQMEAVVGERQQDVEPSALEIWNHVDLRQLEPAARSAVEQLR